MDLEVFYGPPWLIFSKPLPMKIMVTTTRQEKRMMTMYSIVMMNRPL